MANGLRLLLAVVVGRSSSESRWRTGMKNGVDGAQTRLLVEPGQVVVVARQSQAGVTAEWQLRLGIAQGSGFVFDDVGLHVRVEVQMPSEHVSGGGIGAADSCELDVVLVFALGPIHDIVLPVHTEIKTRDRM